MKSLKIIKIKTDTAALTILPQDVWQINDIFFSSPTPSSCFLEISLVTVVTKSLTPKIDFYTICDFFNHGKIFIKRPSNFSVNKVHMENNSQISKIHSYQKLIIQDWEKRGGGVMVKILTRRSKWIIEDPKNCTILSTAFLVHSSKLISGFHFFPFFVKSKKMRTLHKRRALSWDGVKWAWKEDISRVGETLCECIINNWPTKLQKSEKTKEKALLINLYFRIGFGKTKYGKVRVSWMIRS